MWQYKSYKLYVSQLYQLKNKMFGQDDLKVCLQFKKNLLLYICDIYK